MDRSVTGVMLAKCDDQDSFIQRAFFRLQSQLKQTARAFVVKST